MRQTILFVGILSVVGIQTLLIQGTLVVGGYVLEPWQMNSQEHISRWGYTLRWQHQHCIIIHFSHASPQGVWDIVGAFINGWLNRSSSADLFHELPTWLEGRLGQYNWFGGVRVFINAAKFAAVNTLSYMMPTIVREMFETG